MRGPCASSGRGTAADRHVAVEYSSDDEWAGHLLASVRAGLALGHPDVAALADIASAARRRPAGKPVRLLGAPDAVHRILQLFPELRVGLEVAAS